MAKKKVVAKTKPVTEPPKKVEPPVRCKYRCTACGKEFRSADIPPLCIYCRSKKTERL